MRDIKFRAWNKIRLEMIDLHKITPLVLSIDPSLCGAGVGVYIPEHPDLIIEQFTGLRDKNGKEIYENDLFVDANHGLCVIEYSELFASFMMFLVRDKTLGCPLHHTNRANIEISGNIHENGELLK